MPHLQALLEAHVATGDRRTLRAAFDALREEWAGRAARFLRRPLDAPEVEEALVSALSDALSGRPPRALAPGAASSPLAWRCRVLQNALRDQLRRTATHNDYARGAGEGLTPEAVRERRRRAAAERRGAEPEGGVIEVRPAGPDGEAAERLVADRELVRRALDSLAELKPRERVLIALAAGLFVPAGWIEEVAAESGEPTGEILGRIQAHEAAPDERERRARVLFPTGEAQRAMEAFDTALKRARAELLRRVSGGRSA